MRIKYYKGKWIEVSKEDKDGIYYDNYLIKKLDNVKKIMSKKYNWDCVILIDGKEGSGKSTLSFLCAWYISNTKITMNNICEGTEDAVNKLEKLEDGSILIVDEGNLLFSSKDTMKSEQRTLIKILNVIRQKRMCLIIVAPSFFDLNKYIAVQRPRFLLHVFTDKDLNRGMYAYFGERKMKVLYALGRKNYNSYVKPHREWIGRFDPFNPFGESYLELKKKSLLEALRTPETTTRFQRQRDVAIKILKEEYKLKLNEIVKLFERFNGKISKGALSQLLNK